MARSAEQIEVTSAQRAAAGLPVAAPVVAPVAPAPTPVGVVSPFGAATPVPKLPPPNPYTPQPVAVTGGTAPVSVAPAPVPTVYDNGAGTVAQPQSPPPPLYVAPDPAPQVVRSTGGNAPATTMQPTAVTGGTAPVATAPLDTASMITGTAAPAAAVTGGNAPASTAPVAPVATPEANPYTAVTGGNAAISTVAPLVDSPFPTINNPQQVYTPNMGAGNVVQDYLSQLLNDQSGYIQSARRSGIEQAAARGNINSSIAAGNSQRAAIDAAQPILNEITQLHNQREQLAFTGEQNQADRNQQITMAQINDWAANNQFNREYNGQLSLLPITSVTALNNQLMQAAIENPEIFPPEIVSGLGEFFGTNLLSMLQQWFPNQYGGNP